MVGCARRCRHRFVKPGYVFPANVNQAACPDGGINMKLKQTAIFLASALFSLSLNVFAHKVFGKFTKRQSGPRRSALLNRIRSDLDGSEQLLSFGACFIGRQPAMLPDGGPTGAPVLAILHHVNLAAPGKRPNPKSGKSVIPEKIPIFSRRTLEAVNRPLCDPSLRHLPNP